MAIENGVRHDLGGAMLSPGRPPVEDAMSGDGSGRHCGGMASEDAAVTGQCAAGYSGTRWFGRQAACHSDV